MLKNLVKQPLLHFFLMGAAIFIFYGALNPDELGSVGSKEVIVNERNLLTYFQYRTKKFDETNASRALEALSEERLAELIKGYIHEEVLYREALALNLDKNDYVIRRRLMQKVEFITRGFMEEISEPSEEELQRFFEENKEDYYVVPHITFTHVYFSADKRGWDKARSEAVAELEKLNREKIGFADAVRYGDRFLYHLNYVERVPEYVESHLGSDTSTALYTLEADNSKWHGPYESEYGVHLVMVADRSEGRFPSLDELRGRVVADAKNRLLRDNVDAAIDRLIGDYEVKLLYKQGANAKVSAAGEGGEEVKNAAGDT